MLALMKHSWIYQILINHQKRSLRRLKAGLKITIGKGRRTPAVRDWIKKTDSVYLLAPAGCGALLAKRVKKAKRVAFFDLKAEAIYEFKVCDFPVIVGVDSKGKDIYQRKGFKC